MRTRVQRPSSSYSICTVDDSTTGSSPHSHTTSGSGYPAKTDDDRSKEAETVSFQSCFKIISLIIEYNNEMCKVWQFV